MATSDIQAMQDGALGTLGERVAALEARGEYLATKEDIAELKAEIVGIKVWVLVGVVSGSLAALGLLMTYHRFFILP